MMQRFHRMKTLQQYMKSTIGGIVGSVFLDWHLFHRSTTLSYGSLDDKMWFWRKMKDKTTICSGFWGKIEWICGLKMGVFQGVRNRCLGPGRWVSWGLIFLFASVEFNVTWTCLLDQMVCNILLMISFYAPNILTLFDYYLFRCIPDWGTHCI